MSSQKGSIDDIGLFGVIFIGILAYFILIGVYILACFFALLYTLVCLRALRSPVWFGSFAIRPWEAKLFLKCGIAGAVVVPVFTAFAAYLLNKGVPAHWWFYLITGGYASSSIGITLFLEEKFPTWCNPNYVEPVQYTPSQPPVPTIAPFRYASWDDEEPRR